MSVFDQGGAVSIQPDALGFLANNLRGYEATSILREQLQNADDACHKMGRRGELRLEFLPDRLRVTNPSTFDETDWARIVKPSSRGKFTDADQTGEFGIGFWGALHLTDVPIVRSGSLEVTLHPVDGATATEIPFLDGTQFDFVLRREQTDIGTQLDADVMTDAAVEEMLNVFAQQLHVLLLFTRAIDSIFILRPDGVTVGASRVRQPVAGSQ